MARKATIPTFRVRIVPDADAQFEECHGESRPLTPDEYAGNAYMKDGVLVPYEEYRRYYGNPDRHVYAGVIVDKQCACCGQWELHVAAVWDVDFMDDQPEAAYIDARKAYTPAEALALPGYLADVAREELAEAGYVLGSEHHCKRRGCRYWTVITDPTADRRYCAQHQPAKVRNG